MNYKKHLIFSLSPIKQALAQLNELAADAILFVINYEGKLLGSLTDGDVRRGILNDLNLDTPVDSFFQPNPKYIKKGHYTIHQIIEYKEQGFRILPVVDKNHEVVDILNFRFLKSYLPVDGIIMAGGRGERLKPLTDTLPKPLLKVGSKSIIQHNIDRMASFGINNLWISIRYLGNQIRESIGDGSIQDINIQYIEEENPLGTIGAMTLVPNFYHDHILITNSDVLTNIDYEQFFLNFINSDADFSVATIPYDVKIPYAILETNENEIISFNEKPTYTYWANAGIYLMKKSVIQHIPKNVFFNATDLIEKLIQSQHKVISYPLRGYWLDIGRSDDYIKAQQDVDQIFL